MLHERLIYATNYFLLTYLLYLINAAYIAQAVYFYVLAIFPWVAMVASTKFLYVQPG